jgi:hypothetical protein
MSTDDEFNKRIELSLQRLEHLKNAYGPSKARKVIKQEIEAIVEIVDNAGGSDVLTEEMHDRWCDLVNWESALMPVRKKKARKPK